MRREFSLSNRLTIMFSTLLFTCFATASEQLNDLTYYTESYPPANFEQDGQITGYSVDILHAAANAVGQQIDSSQILLRPWPRSYRSVLTTDNTVLFSTTRTEHREHLFNWVGPITDIKVVVLARKSDNITITDPIDMGKYKIGVIRDDIGEQSLLELGIPRDSMQETTSVTTLAEQLLKERIDLLAYAEKAAFWWTSQAGLDSSEFEVVYVLKQGDLYFAFNRNIDRTVLRELQKGLDIIKTKDESGNSVLDEILQHYR